MSSKQYHKKYYQEHREQIRENRDLKKHREQQREYRQRYPAKILEYGRKYYKAHREQFAKNNKTFEKRFSKYKSSAKKRNIEWLLTQEQFLALWQKPCSYCGDPIETIGLDRIDSSKSYTIDNIVPCCKFCNSMKMDYTIAEFEQQCRKIIYVFDRVMV